jgi:hypothetical protein
VPERPSARWAAGCTEITIWSDNHAQSPAGTQAETVTLGGRTYDAWKDVRRPLHRFVPTGLFCAPPPPDGAAGAAFHIEVPQSFYAACEARNAGDRCSTPGFADERTCVLNTENDRLFCAPPPPPPDAVFYFQPHGR